MLQWTKLKPFLYLIHNWLCSCGRRYVKNKKVKESEGWWGWWLTSLSSSGWRLCDRRLSRDGFAFLCLMFPVFFFSFLMSVRIVLFLYRERGEIRTTKQQESRKKTKRTSVFDKVLTERLLWVVPRWCSSHTGRGIIAKTCAYLI